MGLRRGFKTRANEIALQMRRGLELQPWSPVDPLAVAELRGIVIASLSSFATVLPNAVRQLMKHDPKAFSACTIGEGERRMIVLNDAHTPERQRANVAHELSHEILKHPPRPPFDERGCRAWNADAEEEANWLGPALLVSAEAALWIARQGLSLAEAAALYHVSEPVMRFRLNVTGAYKRVGYVRRAAAFGAPQGTPGLK